MIIFVGKHYIHTKIIYLGFGDIPSYAQGLLVLCSGITHDRVHIGWNLG